MLHQASYKKKKKLYFIGKQFNFTGKYALLHNILVYKRFSLNSQQKSLYMLMQFQMIHNM